MNQGMNLVGAWNTLWSQLTSGNGIGNLLAVIGVAIIVFFVAKWLWDRRRGGGGGFPVMPTVLGLVLAGPSFMFPVILTLLDALLNFFIGLIGWITERF